MTTVKPMFMVFFITILAFGLRFYGLDRVPPSMYWDELAIGLDGRHLAQTGKDMHNRPWHQAIFYSYGDYKAPVYIWFSGLAQTLFGSSIITVRLPSVLAGTISVVLVYAITLQLFRSSQIALATQLFMAIHPTAIHFSRVAFEANVALTFLLISLFTLLLSRKKNYMVLFSSIAGALAVYSYFSARLVVPLIIIGWFILFSKKEIKRLIIPGIVALIGFSLALIPLFKSPFYEASNRFRMSNHNLFTDDQAVINQNRDRLHSGNTLLSRIIYHRYWNRAYDFINNTATHVDLRYLFFTGDTNPRHNMGTGLMLSTTLMFFFIGLSKLMSRYKRLCTGLVWWWLVALIPAALVFEVPHTLRTLSMLPITAVILGLGFIHAGKLKYIILTVVLIQAAVTGHYYATHYPRQEAEAWHYTPSLLAQTAVYYSKNNSNIYLPKLYNIELYLAWYMGNDDLSYFHLGPITQAQVSTLPKASIVAMPLEDYNQLTTPVTMIQPILNAEGSIIYYLIKT